jgi:hypothetical protein
VLDPLSFPGVGDVDESDHCRIRVFARLAFEDERSTSRPAVVRHGDVQRRSATLGVVVDEEMASAAQRHGIDAGVRIRQRNQREPRNVPRSRLAVAF